MLWCASVLTINETHIKRDEQENGLKSKHLERFQEIAVGDVFQVDLILVSFSMDCPVFGGESNLLGPFLEEHRSECLANGQR